MNIKFHRRFCLLQTLSVLLNFQVAIGYYTPGNCPRSCVCSLGCRDSSVHCQQASLPSIPDDLNMCNEKLTFVNVKFDSNRLQRSNFSRYGHLRILTFRVCFLEAIDADAFVDLPNLEEIDLTYNNLKVIHPGTFSGLNLEWLILNYNPGIEIQVGAFLGAQIKRLALGICNIIEIDTEVFLPIRSSLKTLYLQGNKLQELPEQMEAIFYDVDDLEIGSNPWNCDCKLKWLKEFVDSNSRKMFWSYPRCETPSQLQGKSFLYLRVEDFQCPSNNSELQERG